MTKARGSRKREKVNWNGAIGGRFHSYICACMLRYRESERSKGGREEEREERRKRETGGNPLNCQISNIYVNPVATIGYHTADTCGCYQ